MNTHTKRVLYARHERYYIKGPHVRYFLMTMAAAFALAFMLLMFLFLITVLFSIRR